MTAAELLADMRRFGRVGTEDVVRAMRFCFEHERHWSYQQLPVRPDDDPPPSAA